MLWANLHLLFWLSLFPFATGWMGENHFARAADGALRRRAADGGDRLLDPAAGDHRPAGRRTRCCKRRSAATGRASCRRCSMLAAIAVHVLSASLVRSALYACVALLWLVPDRRIEHALQHKDG